MNLSYAKVCIDRYNYYIPDEIFEIIKELVYYPHEYPGLERKRYNKFLKTLPKLAINPGPKIIFNSSSI